MLFVSDQTSEQEVVKHRDELAKVASRSLTFQLFLSTQAMLFDNVVHVNCNTQPEQRVVELEGLLADREVRGLCPSSIRQSVLPTHLSFALCFLFLIRRVNKRC